MYSNDDHHGLILFLKDGKLQLGYHSLYNMTSQLVFDDNQIINDGQQHHILISHQVSPTILYKNMYIQIDKRDTQISIPSSPTLFFDVITIGGSRHVISNDLFVGCIGNVTYNYHPLLPEGSVKSDRFDCFYEHDSICDRQMPCDDIQPLQFCGQDDCSLVCTPPVNDKTESILQYSSSIKSGKNEQLYFTIFTTSGNSTLFNTRNGSIQVSIVLQVYSNKIKYSNLKFNFI